MPRMKQLLRKLHIGSGVGVHEHQRLGVSTIDTVTIHSPQSLSSPSSAALDPFPLPTATPPCTTGCGTLAVTSDARGSGGVDLNFFEEEFQVQMALAISASDHSGSIEDAETAQIKAAEHISLMGSLPTGLRCETLVESLSLRYWNSNFIKYDEKVEDGFYDVYDITKNMTSQRNMPLLVDLHPVSLADHVDYEVILVDRAVDLELQELENTAYGFSVDLQSSMDDPILSGLVKKIADLVVCRMGGPVGDAEDILKRWRARSFELGDSLNTIVLHLGRLDVGLSRHRALLFKVLADKINLPCMLVKGSHDTGTDEGAVNIIKTECGSEYIIDLMGAPGALIPAELPTGLLQNSRLNLNSSENVTDLVNDSNAELNKVVEALAVASVGDSKSNAGIQIKEAVNNWADFEQDFGKFLPSLHITHKNPLTTFGNILPAPNTQVMDISNYVGSASKNPQFVQKLRAVLLESGASPPSNLLKNIDSLDEHKMIDQIQFMDLHNVNDSNESQFDNNHCFLPFPFESTNDTYELIGSGINPELGEVADWEIPWEALQIGERIGIGSYGEVYRAEWNGTEVAVKKFLDQDFFGEALLQFKYEAEIMIRMRHPNVVLFMGAVTRSPNSSILTEFLPRGSLYKLLHRTRMELDEKRRMQMALDVAKGMNYLHTGNPPIVHRDLKSPNLLVDKNWVVKVCDFGLSRLKHHTFLSSKSTAGTAEWMAPEVLKNEPSNEKCDVYSFGVILWELATLRVPWSGLNPMQVVGAVGFQNRRLEIPVQVDPMLAQIIVDCWQSDAKSRPSFSQLISRLRCIQASNNLIPY